MSRGGRGGQTSSRNARPGDWTCPSCHANVFASKTECFRCQTPKPGWCGGGGGRRRDQPPSSGRHFSQSFRATRSPDEVLGLLKTIQQEGTKLDVKMMSMAISALGRMRGGWKSAVELLRS